MKNSLIFSLVVSFFAQQGFCLDNYNGIMKVDVSDMKLENLNISVDGPSAIVIIDNFAYVSNYISGALLKINLDDKTVTTFRDENMKRPLSMVANDDGSFIYIADASYGLFVFNTSTEQFTSLKIDGRLQWLAFSGENTLWALIQGLNKPSALAKINVTTNNPEIVNEKILNFEGNCIAYDNRGSNKNIIIGQVGGIKVYDTINEEFSDFGIDSNVLSLCIAGLKLYFTGFEKNKSSILGWVDVQYETQFERNLGENMRYMVKDPTDDILYISDLGVMKGDRILPPGCKEGNQKEPYVVRGGSGTSVYQWSTSLDRVLDSNSDCNNPWAMAIQGQYLYVLDLPPAIMSISCPSFMQLKRLPFQRFKGGFAR